MTSGGLDSNSRNIVYTKNKVDIVSSDTTNVPGPFRDDSRAYPLNAVKDPHKSADDSLGSYVENCWTESLTSMKMRD